jgi:hypothetical protein
MTGLFDFDESDGEPLMVDVELIITRTTAKAVLVTNLKGKDVWLPRSRIRGGRRLEAGDQGTYRMAEDLALEEELI